MGDEIQSLIDEVRAKIAEYPDRGRLCDETGVLPSTLSEFVSGKQSTMEAANFLRLCWELEVDTGRLESHERQVAPDENMKRVARMVQARRWGALARLAVEKLEQGQASVAVAVAPGVVATGPQKARKPPRIGPQIGAVLNEGGSK